jgi:hypothetical protein
VLRSSGIWNVWVRRLSKTSCRMRYRV